MSAVKTDPKAIDWVLRHAVDQTSSDVSDLREKMLKGERLRVFVAMDPTQSSLHLGHVLPLRKLAEFQALGHEVIFLLGDVTAVMGDASEKPPTRVWRTSEQILEFGKGYLDQLALFLKLDGPNAAQIRRTSEWCHSMSFSDVVELAAYFTVEEMSARDVFKKRLEEEKPIYLYEYVYPILRGYNAVALEADVEIGGTDQVFVMKIGKKLMNEMKQKTLSVLASSLVLDVTGDKMGSNPLQQILLSETPENVYGQLMRWSDAMIVPGFELFTEKSVRLNPGENPMSLKQELAHTIVAQLFGAESADRAAAHFSHVHQDGAMPEVIEECSVGQDRATVIDALVLSKLADSKTDARRQIEQKAVKLAGEVITDVKREIDIPTDGIVLQKGKRGFIKLVR